MMIKNNELTIGNHVLYKDMVHKVYCPLVNMVAIFDKKEISTFQVKYNEVFGVPVSEEILEKIGFTDDGVTYTLFLTDEIVLLYDGCNFYLEKDSASIPLNIKYVHEIQNFFRVFNNFELNIYE